MNLGLPGEPVDDALLVVVDLLPGGDGVRLVQLAGAEDEVGEIRRGHAGVLGVGVGGEEGEGPLELAAGIAGEVLLQHLGAGLLHQDLAGGVDGGGGFGVGVGQDVDGDIGLLADEALDRGDVLELLV